MDSKESDPESAIAALVRRRKAARALLQQNQTSIIPKVAQVTRPTRSAHPPPQPTLPDSSCPPSSHTLPYDVLYHIFLNSRERARKSYTPAVAQVCRYWRAIAIETCPLWTHIRIDITDHRPLRGQALWIERSGSNPLHLYICSYHGRGISPQVMRLLMPHLSRWKSLVIDGLHERDLQRVLDPLANAFAPMLEVLDVANAAEDGWTFRPFGGGAPRLKTLWIGCGKFDVGAPLFNVLKKLCLTARTSNQHGVYFTVHEIFAVLSHAADSLEELRIEECGPTGLKQVKLPIVLPRLKILQLATPGENAAWIREIMLGIRAPALKSLASEVSSNLLEVFLDNSFRPFPGLLSLHIKGRQWWEPQIELSSFAIAFSNLPQLSALTVAYCPLFDPQMLATHLPQLQTLKILRAYQADSATMSLEGMVRARKNTEGFSAITKIELEGVELPSGEADWLAENITSFRHS